MPRSKSTESTVVFFLGGGQVAFPLQPSPVLNVRIIQDVNFLLTGVRLALLAGLERCPAHILRLSLNVTCEPPGPGIGDKCCQGNCEADEEAVAVTVGRPSRLEELGTDNGAELSNTTLQADGKSRPRRTRQDGGTPGPVGYVIRGAEKLAEYTGGV